jgi:hypothetical protein
MHNHNFLRDEFDIPEDVLTVVLKCSRAGSAWTCDPPVLTSDRDILLLVSPDLRTDDKREQTTYVRDMFFHAGWDVHSDYHNSDGATEIAFVTARKGINNAIIYSDPVGFERFATATRICKELNLLNKEDRVRVHIAATEFVTPEYPSFGF